MSLINWKLLENNPIPKEANGLILPGGFPETYAEEISQCKRSLSSINKFFCKKPIYAECGGMIILCEKLSN